MNRTDRQTDRREMFFQCHCLHFTKYDPISMIMYRDYLPLSLYLERMCLRSLHTLYQGQPMG